MYGLEHVEDIEVWYDNLYTLERRDLRPGIGLVVTDMINGFTYDGALASPRVKALVPGIVNLTEQLRDYGTKLFVSIQDAHRVGAIEFQSFPEHAIEGSVEAQMIRELWDTGVYWKVFEKNTLSAAAVYPSFNNELLGWTQQRNPSSSTTTSPCNINTFVVVGNCTDLCVYQAAMHIRQYANELHLKGVEVIVPATLVDTFDAPFHPADLYHKLFLKHMEMNGITVVKEIKW